MIIKVETLNRIFEVNNNAGYLCIEGKCNHCQCDTKVEISRTTGGYGLQGGVLYQSNARKSTILCSKCFNKTVSKI